jgi:FkbM family methyltransferase
MKRIKERLRDIVGVVTSRILLLHCPAFVNRVYNGLPHQPLNWLVQHGFFGRPGRPFPWRIKLANGSFLRLSVDPTNKFDLGFAFDYKVHDVGLKRLQEYLVDRMSDRSVYLDIGANIGVSSIYALSCGRPCWLFEPNSSLRPFVEKLFAANHYRTARLEPVALSDVAGEAEFFVSPSSFLSSFDQKHAASEGVVIPVRVPLRTLDSYLPELIVAAHELVVKIDVEGHEMAVLRGAVETLQRYRPPVMIELLMNAGARSAAFAFMAELGYACHGIVNTSRMTLIALATETEAIAFGDINFLFVPKERPWPHS